MVDLDKFKWIYYNDIKFI